MGVIVARLKDVYGHFLHAANLHDGPFIVTLESTLYGMLLDVQITFLQLF